MTGWQSMGRQASFAAAGLRSIQILFGAIASAPVGLLYDDQSAIAVRGVTACFGRQSVRTVERDAPIAPPDRAAAPIAAALSFAIGVSIS